MDYVPLKQIEKFHEDQSFIKILEGEQATGTTVGLIQEMVASGGEHNLILVPTHAYFFNGFVRTVEQWFECVVRRSPPVSVLIENKNFDVCYVSTRDWLSTLKGCRYGKVYMSGIDDFKDIRKILKEVIFYTRPSQVVVEKKQDPDLYPFSIHTLERPLLEGGDVRNPKAEVEHMPRGFEYFEGIVKSRTYEN